MEFQLLLTHDGSYTVYSHRFHATYHSIFGAISESQWVFIQGSYLESFLETQKAISILEIGLGTGYNLLLTLLKTRSHPTTSLHYVAFEPFPLPSAILKTIYQNQFLFQHLPLSKLIHHEPQWQWNQVKVTIHYEPWTPQKTLHHYWDLVYFDAFSPRHHPSLWHPLHFWHLYLHLRPGGRIVTYSVTGNLLRALRQWQIPYLKRKGFAKKREMLVIIRPFPLRRGNKEFLLATSSPYASPPR